MNTVVKKAEELGMSLETVKKALKSVQSQKCRLGKQRARKDFDVEMTKVLKEEKLLQDVRAYLDPPKLTVTTMSAEQIANLDYEQTVRAIKSIQSKKCLTQYTDDKVEYNRACEIEDLLKTHRETIKPEHKSLVRKSDIDNLVESIEQQESIDKGWLLNLLKSMTGQ